MKIKSIAPWFGGKRTLAPEIVRQLGAHAQYFEPFCGSLAVLFGKPQSRQETVNDLHFDVTNLAMCLQDNVAAPWIYERLQRTILCERLLKDSQRYLTEPPSEGARSCRERAYWYFLASWMARNGIAGMDRQEYQLAVRWTAGGGSPSIRFRSATESIPAWHARLKNVVVLNRDGLVILPQFEDATHTAIYVDPPYVRESRSHGNYLHDFSEGFMGLVGDHERLAEILEGFTRSRIVVSYYDCPRIRELYAGWTFMDCARNKNLHSQNGRGARKTEAPEVLIVNGDLA